jgi:hypothetical protein
MAMEERPHGAGDLVDVGLEREMAGVEQVDLGVSGSLA